MQINIAHIGKIAFYKAKINSKTNKLINIYLHFL